MFDTFLKVIHSSHLCKTPSTMNSEPFNFCWTSYNWAARFSSVPSPYAMLASFVANVEC